VTDRLDYTPPQRLEAAAFGRRVVVRVGNQVVYLTPDESAAHRQSLFEAEGEARGNAIAGGAHG
jgi:hypothetical protein